MIGWLLLTIPLNATLPRFWNRLSISVIIINSGIFLLSLIETALYCPKHPGTNLVKYNILPTKSTIRKGPNIATDMQPVKWHTLWTCCRPVRHPLMWHPSSHFLPPNVQSCCLPCSLGNTNDLLYGFLVVELGRPMSCYNSQLYAVVLCISLGCVHST